MCSCYCCFPFFWLFFAFLFGFDFVSFVVYLSLLFLLLFLLFPVSLIFVLCFVLLFVLLLFFLFFVFCFCFVLFVVVVFVFFWGGGGVLFVGWLFAALLCLYIFPSPVFIPGNPSSPFCLFVNILIMYIYLISPGIADLSSRFVKLIRPSSSIT